MSRLDYFTVAIVAICIAAIIFLLYRTTDLFKSDLPADPPAQEEPAANEPVEDVIDPAEYDPDYAGDYVSDDSTEAKAGAGSGKENPDSSPKETDVDGTASDTKEEVAEEDYSDLYKAGGGVGDYLVLAGSFEFMHNAENQAGRLKALGYSDSEVVLFNRGKYATVLVDRFDNMADASALVSRLNGQNVEAYVHEKRGANQ